MTKVNEKDMTVSHSIGQRLTLSLEEIKVCAQIIAEEREKSESKLQEQHEAMAAYITSGSDNPVIYGLGKYHDYGPQCDSLELRWDKEINKAAERYRKRQEQPNES